MTLFKCPSCCWAYREMADLVAHCKEDHHSPDTSSAGVEHIEILLECPWCQVVFEHQNELVYHVTVHHRTICQTLELQIILKLFKCPLCKWGYRRPADLISHSKEKHHVSDDTTAVNVENIEVLLECRFCRMVFDNQQELTYHRMMVHQ